MSARTPQKPTVSKEARRAFKASRKAALRAGDDADAWRTLAERAKSAGRDDDADKAWLEAARLEEACGHFVGALRGFRRAGGGSRDANVARVRRKLALALGAVASSAALLAGAVPPLDLWPLGLVALVPIYATVRSMAPGAAFAYAWLTGLLINLYGFAWGVGVMDRFGHVAPQAASAVVFAVCAYQALVFGLWGYATAFIVRRGRLSWLFVAPLTFALAESVVPFPFPWFLAVTVWRAWPLVQVIELGGPTAASALVVLVNVVVAEVWLARSRRTAIERPVKAAAVVAACVVALGLARAGHVAVQRAHAPHVRVGVVQPNFGITSADARRQHGHEQIETLRTKTDELGRRGAELVVWPESAFPFLFDRQLEREFAPGHPWSVRSTFRGHVLVGAPTHEFGGADVHNSAVLIAPDGRVAGRYDKVRLMPFGEYVPLADRFPAWAARARDRMPDAADVVAGTGAAVLEAGTLRIAPMICYEDILPDTARDIDRLHPGANLLATLANHAWFGGSLAPRLAEALATMRSIELRRDLVRATNTGVSSIGDALGRVHAEGALVDRGRDRPGTPELVEGEVALLDGFAFGAIGGRLFPYAAAAALVVGALWRCRRRS